MKLAVIGRTGQLARALGQRGAACHGRDAIDLTDSDTEITRFIRALDADIVINAAAWTDVALAETQEAAAHQINAQAVGHIARACQAHALPFIHISTDYVFDGIDGPYAPTNAPHPLNAYGRTKLAGERGLADWGHIVRTSWVYDLSAQNFVSTMLKLSESKTQLDVVSDEIGRPTFSGDLAEGLVRLSNMILGGHSVAKILHMAGGGMPVSRANFARAIFAAAGRQTQVNDVKSSDYPSPVTRPLNAVLDISDNPAPLPDWQATLSSLISA